MYDPVSDVELTGLCERDENREPRPRLSRFVCWTDRTLWTGWKPNRCMYLIHHFKLNWPDFVNGMKTACSVGYLLLFGVELTGLCERDENRKVDTPTYFFLGWTDRTLWTGWKHVAVAFIKVDVCWTDRTLWTGWKRYRAQGKVIGLGVELTGLCERDELEGVQCAFFWWDYR